MSGSDYALFLVFLIFIQNVIICFNLLVIDLVFNFWWFALFMGGIGGIGIILGLTITLMCLILFGVMFILNQMTIMDVEHEIQYTKVKYFRSLY